MITTMNQPYNQTPSKIRTLWDTAVQLIGLYEDFDRKLTSLDIKFNDLSTKLTASIETTKNVQ